jgi:urease subunit gamma/beta
MRLTAWEEERLLIFTAAELARRHRDRGLALNHPEAVALMCDAMLEAARGGAGFDEVEQAGLTAVAIDDLMPDVAPMIDEVRLEVLLGDGVRLIVLTDPFGAAGADGPGGREPTDRVRDPAAGLDRRELTVRNTGRRVVRVSSHYPFHLVNPRLEFDREAATGFRLDLPSGADERWGPGEVRTVRLARFTGSQGTSR